MLTVIGEALIDIVEQANRPTQAHPGGSPMNVAVGVARLGCETEFIGRFGHDEHGRLIQEHLLDSGVSLAVEPDEHKTSTALAKIGSQGAAEYEFDIDWSLDTATSALVRASKESSAIHIGSIGAMLTPGAEQVFETIKNAHHNALISYDPNCRPSIIPDVAQARQWAEKFIPYVDVVKASDEDLQWLYPDRSIEDTAQAWCQMGASLVVLTRGESGPWAISRGTGMEPVSVNAFSVEVADTVGAGDSLMAALLAYLLERGIEGASAREKIEQLSQQDIADMLNFSAVAAGITVSRPGANPPSCQELLATLENQQK